MTPESYDIEGATAEYAELWREWGVELSPAWRSAANLAAEPSAPEWAELKVAFLQDRAWGPEETQLFQKIVQAMGLTLGRDAGAWPVAGADWRGSVPGTPAVCVVLGPEAWALVSEGGDFVADRGRFHPSPAHPDLRLMPTWSPYHLLRNPEAKKILWEDMKLVVRGLAESAC